MNTLVVDDQEDNRYLLRSLLMSCGHQVTEAANGKKALEILAEGTWDLVISDILMPVMDGYQLCREIRSSERLRHLPFIFYTATYVDQKDEEFALRLGADRFFRKPMEPQLFMEHIRNLIEEIAKNQGKARPTIQGNEKEILKLYNERLVHKLEAKMLSLEKEIAERKRAEEALRASLAEKEALLREIHHRVKNNMQVISSLFSLQAEKTRNRECLGILREGQARIRSMSLVHEKLYRSRDFSKIDLADYIQSLVVQLLRAYLVDPKQVRLETNLEEVLLDINSAVPCGMILNELISNALKHAFPKGRTGVIKIGLKQGTGGTIELRVADDGVGFPEELDFRKPESFGLQLVNLLADQLDATFELDRGNGTAFAVSFCELKYTPRI
jgi:two-component sensor histidine kinase/DNA-binding NarL/FixJ family response regulator